MLQRQIELIISGRATCMPRIFGVYKLEYFQYVMWHLDCVFKKMILQNWQKSAKKITNM